MKRLAIVALLLLALLAAVIAVSAQDTQTDTSEQTQQQTQQQTQSESEDNPVVLRSGDTEERLSDFERRFEIAMLGVAAQQGVELNDELRAQLSVYRPQFLEQRATEIALLNEANARSLSVSDEELEAQLEQIRGSANDEESFEDVYTGAGFESEEALRSYLGEQLLVEKLVTALREGVAISEEDVAAAYEARAEDFMRSEQVCARHILLESEADAEDVMSELANGADFAELARERSTGPSGPDGGDLGCFERERMVAPFAEAAFAAETNAPVGPVETQFGFHVILVYDRQAAAPVPLEEVAPQLESQLSQEAFVAEIDALREASGVETFPEAVALPETLQPDNGEGAVGEDGATNESGADDADNTAEDTTEDTTDDTTDDASRQDD